MNQPVAAVGEPVAIVGVGCRFPGGAADVHSFWQLLQRGADAITEIPQDRIDLARYFNPEPATPGRVMTRWGGFLEGIDKFDADFFGISPREAERLDPQQRLLLEIAWEALEDAGQDIGKLSGSRTAVIVGQWLSDFEGRLFDDAEGVDFLMTTGSGRYASSGRISYALGLRGPSLTLDTACSSSMAAIHLAVRSLRSGESDMALAGGVNVILQPHISIAYSQSRMMAPDGHCKFGDANGDGYVRSEGAGLVVLKRLHRAVRDGDRIYAVIRGSAINNDGRSSGSMGTPSRLGQEELLESAYRDAGIEPARVGYIEAHGTGTRAGDPVEVGALGAVLRRGRSEGSTAWLGSVKTNIGHTEGAAGVAGLIKAALALHHGQIPASLHCRELNPAIPWSELPLRIARELQSWTGDGGATRVAGVSAFGIAGSNAHVVLEEAPRAAPNRGDERPARGCALLPLSARSPEALQALAGRFAERLAGETEPSLHALCRVAATRRTALPHRAAFVAEDGPAMAELLRRFSEGEEPSAGNAPAADAAPRIAFVVPGQGAQWLGMARDMAAHEPAFQAALRQCDEAARRYTDWSIVEQLNAEPCDPGYCLDRIDVIQPVLVAIAIAYAALWRSLGIEPDAVVGHSMGEVGAACIAGVLTLDQAMHIVCRRSALMRRTSGHGAMALVELSMEDARAHLGGREAELAVAVSNSPRSSVISGEPDALNALMAELERDGVFCRLVKVDVASHSPQMESVAAALQKELGKLQPQPARLPIFSTVLGRQAQGLEFDASYWGRNLRQPVLFSQAVDALIADGVTVFVELGPHPVLLPSIEQTAQARGATATAVACGRRGESEQAVFLDALGALWVRGCEVPWSRVLPGSNAHLDLPLYPWQRERHWAQAAERRGGAARAVAPARRCDEESLSWLHRLQWRALDAAPMSAHKAACGRESRSGRWLLVAAHPALGAALSDALAAAGERVASVALSDLAAELVPPQGAGSIRGVLALLPDADDAAYFPVHVLQAALGSAERAGVRLFFLTRGAHTVEGAGRARVSVEQAAAWGAARVVGEEHPALWGGLIDLDPAVRVEENAPALLAHLLAADGEDQVALRAGRRFVLRLVTQRIDKPPSFAWRPDAACLITGGLGDLGLRVASTLVAHGARRLVLLGRTAMPPRAQWNATPSDTTAGRRIAAIRALEAQGAAVQVDCVDVGDEAQLRSFLSRYEAEAWPPIRSVIHAAGTFDNQLSARMDRRAFDAVLRPKLVGAQLLDRLLPELDLFVMFSSTGAFLVQPGQANYAAANAGLDALALDRQARGLPATSIAWGVWENTGLVRNEAGARNVAEMARQGVHGFAPERGDAMFAWLCGQPDATVAVLPVDWAAFWRARAGREFPIFRELASDATAGPAGAGAGLENESPAERRTVIEGVVRDAVSRVLKIAPSRLDARKALGGLGLNSLMAMELRNRLEAALKRSLSATLAWNHPTIEALVAHLAGDAPATPASRIAPAPVAATAAAGMADDVAASLTQLSALSDEEAALALRSARR